MSNQTASVQTQFTIQEIAAFVGGVLHGAPDITITGLASIDEAQPGELVFAESGKYLLAAVRSKASAVLATAETEALHGEKPIIVVTDPRLAFTQVLARFARPIAYLPGVHPSAQIGERANIAEGVHIGANVTLGDEVTLEAGAALQPGVCIGDGCVVGKGSILHSNVVLYPRTIVGKRCVIQAGTVIGAEGFGFVSIGSGLKRVPHVGIVQIGDEVEIGANVTIDRAKTGATVIGSGTKIDNLVHIAHNVHIGQSCILVSQVGLAGSVTLGNGVILAGQVGIVPHIHIGDGARLAAQSGLMNDVPAGETWFGSPAIPHSHRLREIAASRKLPETMKQIRSLERRLAEMEARLNEALTAMSPTRTSPADPHVPIIAEETDGIGFERSLSKDVGPVG